MVSRSPSGGSHDARDTTLCNSSIDLQCGVGSMGKCVTDVSSRSINVCGAWIGGFTSNPRPVKVFGS